MHVVALGRVGLALTGERQDVFLDRELNVLVAEPRHLGLEEQSCPGIGEGDAREAPAAPDPLGLLGIPVTRGLDALFEEAIHPAAELVDDGERSVEVAVTVEHDVLPLPTWA